MIDYTCECDSTDRKIYAVTSHDGIITRCNYCAECADLASVDWNGETAVMEVLGEVTA